MNMIKEQKNEDIKKIFNRWGTYLSLTKDVAIINYFMDNPNTEIRQKTIINHFKDEMSAETVRVHLYKLVEKGLLHETNFKGQYILYPENSSEICVACDKLIKVVLGEKVYNLAVENWKKRYLDKRRDLEHY